MMHRGILPGVLQNGRLGRLGLDYAAARLRAVASLIRKRRPEALLICIRLLQAPRLLVSTVRCVEPVNLCILALLRLIFRDDGPRQTRRYSRLRLLIRQRQLLAVRDAQVMDLIHPSRLRVLHRGHPLHSRVLAINRLPVRHRRLLLITAEVEADLAFPLRYLLIVSLATCILSLVFFGVIHGVQVVVVASVAAD